MIVYGRRIVELVVKRHKELIKTIYLSKEIDKKFFHSLKLLNKPIIKLDSKKVQSLARGGNHQGYLLEIESLQPISLKEVCQMEFVLVLCGVSDVGNIGSIFRTAYALGVSGIVICGVNNFKQEGAIRASAGAMLDMQFCVEKNALDVINVLKNSQFILCGTSINGEILDNIPRQEKIALFLGNEEVGLTNRVISKMDHVLTIPFKRDFDSLNVGVAGGILIDRINSWKN